MYEYILKNKLNSIYRKQPREKRFLNWKNIHTVLIMFDTAHLDEVSVFIKQLKKNGKKVTVCAYQKNDDKQQCSTNSYYVISKKDAGKWFDNPLHSIAQELKKKTFDAVIDLTLNRNIPLEYLLAHTSASVKAGFKKTNFSPYDLAITSLPLGDAESYQIKELYKQIVYYLDQIGAG